VGDGCAILPTCDRFEVLVDGKVESNRPALAECFLECPLAAAVKDATDGDMVGGFCASGDMPGRPWASLGECALETDLAAA
jgi:hypothetical protein